MISFLLSATVLAAVVLPVLFLLGFISVGRTNMIAGDDGVPVRAAVAPHDHPPELTEEEWISLSGVLELSEEQAKLVLGVPLYATSEQITATYKDCARRFHPDRAERSDEEGDLPSDDKMKMINEAYEVLNKSEFG